MHSAKDQIKARLASSITDERTILVRNTFLAGSALATAILVALTQVGAKEIALKVTVVACSITAPTWLCLAACLEAYLHLGDDLEGQLLMLRTSKVYVLLQVVGGIALYVALCGVVSFLLPWALYVFIAASAIGAVYVVSTYVQVAKSLLSRQ
jgi:hypothetical protein